MFLPCETELERKQLILIKETIERYGYDPLELGRHSKMKVVFKCIVCGQPHETSNKLLLDKKGLTHPGECRNQLRKDAGIRARQNEDPKHRETRKQKLREKIAKDKDKIIAKRQNTLIEKYGSKDLSKIDSIRENISKGVSNAYLKKGKQIIAKRQATNLERYNSTNFLTSDQGILHVQAMSLRLFGTKYPFQNKEHRIKAIEHQVRRLSDRTTSYEYMNNHPSSKYINRYIANKVLDELGEEAFKDFCNKIPSRTILEYDAQKLLDNAEFFNRFPEKHIRYKPDFKLSNGNNQIYVNVDGLYWHSECEKDQHYHKKIREVFKTNNLKLLQFRSDEIYNKGEIVKSIIDNSLGIYQYKYNARQCEIKSVNQEISQKFYEFNHLMGFAGATAFGLFFENQLISLISVKRKEDGIEIVRFGSKLFSCVRGGFSKLLNHVIKIYKPKKIISFCDLRYATGESYLKLGFELESISQGWQWTDFNKTFNRLKCRANMDDRKLTQEQHAKEFGWFKIYDAGQAKYIKYI